MTCNDHASSPIRPSCRLDDGALVASLELSPSKWLVTSLSPGSEKLSKRWLNGGDGAGLLRLLGELKAKSESRVGREVRIISIQEAGLDGFWLHRLLEANGIESHVVDAASVSMPRRKRRAKSDTIDGETLVRTLLAWLRGEPRVCSMVRPPSVEAEDRRRLTRERDTLVRERIRLSNRIRGLLASQGVVGYEPLRRDRRERLSGLLTGDGHRLEPRLGAEIVRALDRLELVLGQIAEIEAARDQEIAAAGGRDPAALLPQLRSLGQESVAVLCFEGFWRSFDNRRQIGAYAGLAPTPWRSGQTVREQGVAKAGNPRLRKAIIQLAWLWQRHQPHSALSRWFNQRVGQQKGRVRRVAIVAMARKLLVALWRYTTQGILPEGAVLKAA
jgi:transposase